jgi:uncharacterized membrane protein
MADFLTPEQRQQIVAAIAQAELNTSGEIRVHLVARCKRDPMDAARTCFEKLGMTATEKRNGVLFFLAYRSHTFTVLGDKGINDVVPENFWQEVVDLMSAQFREERFTEGLCEGILRAGEIMKAHFPYEADDRNELSNEISHE